MDRIEIIWIIYLERFVAVVDFTSTKALLFLIYRFKYSNGQSQVICLKLGRFKAWTQFWYQLPFVCCRWIWFRMCSFQFFGEIYISFSNYLLFIKYAEPGPAQPIAKSTAKKGGSTHLILIVKFKAPKRNTILKLQYALHILGHHIHANIHYELGL